MIATHGVRGPQIDANDFAHSVPPSCDPEDLGRLPDLRSSLFSRWICPKHEAVNHDVGESTPPLQKPPRCADADPSRRAAAARACTLSVARGAVDARCLGDRHLRRPQQALVQPIAGTRARRPPRRPAARRSRPARPPRGWLGSNAWPAASIRARRPSGRASPELVQDHLDAGDQAADAPLPGRGVVDGPPGFSPPRRRARGCRAPAACHAAAARWHSAGLGLLALHAALEVLELGALAQQLRSLASWISARRASSSRSSSTRSAPARCFVALHFAVPRRASDRRRVPLSGCRRCPDTWNACPPRLLARIITSAAVVSAFISDSIS